jgi:hypothetical protein
MSARKRLRAACRTIADYSPVHVSPGRLYVGRVVILTMSELQRTAMRFEEIGHERGAQQVLELVAKAGLTTRVRD